MFNKSYVCVDENNPHFFKIGFTNASNGTDRGIKHSEENNNKFKWQLVFELDVLGLSSNDIEAIWRSTLKHHPDVSKLPKFNDVFAVDAAMRTSIVAMLEANARAIQERLAARPDNVVTLPVAPANKVDLNDEQELFLSAVCAFSIKNNFDHFWVEVADPEYTVDEDFYNRHGVFDDYAGTLQGIEKAIDRLPKFLTEWDTNAGNEIARRAVLWVFAVSMRRIRPNTEVWDIIADVRDSTTMGHMEKLTWLLDVAKIINAEVEKTKTQYKKQVEEELGSSEYESVWKHL